MHRTQGIILATEKLGETDQLVSVFSKDFGKLKAVAQGSLKHDSKMRSIVQAGHMIDGVFIPLRSGRFRLTSAFLIESHPRIRNHGKKLSVSLFSLGLMDSVFHENERDENVWNFLTSWFTKLETADIQSYEQAELSARRFSAELLARLGGVRESHLIAEALSWGVLEEAYQTSLGFSLPRYFLIQ